MIRSSRKYTWGGSILLIVLLVTVLLVGLLKRHSVEQRRTEMTSANEKGPIIEVTEVKKSQPERDVTTIGEARPFFEATVYAKVAGYLKTIEVDKGDWVKEGDRIGVIESPETDKAYLQAYADYWNKKKIAQRYTVLLKRKLVSNQEAEQAFSNEQISEAILQQQKVLKNYEVVLAPFTGRVTARFTDPGALIQNAQGSQTSAQALVTISKVDVLRIYSYVNQQDAPFVKAGNPVEISLTERPGVHIPAKVTRVSGALDSQTRTLLTEVDLDNSSGDIVAGSFVTVNIKLGISPKTEIPSTALVIRGTKTLVPVVDRAGTVHYRPIHIYSNDGENILVDEGLQEGERVALSLGTTVFDGQKIQARETSMAGQKAGQAPLKH